MVQTNNCVTICYFQLKIFNLNTSGVAKTRDLGKTRPCAALFRNDISIFYRMVKYERKICV